MRTVQQFLTGIVVALVSIAIVVGGISLSFAEGNLTAPSQDLPPSETFTLPPSIPPSETPTWQPWQPNTPLSASSTSLLSTSTFTLPAPPTACPPPEGWVVYTVQSDDTLEDLSERYHLAEGELALANCLITPDLLPGSLLYVSPVATRTPVPCGPPTGWVRYPVQPGDTLYRIARSYGVTVRQLQNANCMGNSTLLVVGKWLYVPPWAARTPTGIYWPIYDTETPAPPPYETFNLTPNWTP